MRSSSSKAALAALLLFCILPFTAATGGTLSLLSQSRWVDVARILDGDTFVTTQGEHVRLLGINTPEVAHEASPAQEMGDTAARSLRGLIAGQSVRLDFDQQRKDDYGRTLAQVYLRNGSWVNAELVRLGMAHVYTFTPNLHWAGQLLAVESSARQAGLGIWATRRFAVLESGKISTDYLGQFRLVSGQVSSVSRNHFVFQMGQLKASIPRKYRPYFSHPPLLAVGDSVVVHGVIRASLSGLYIALHSPYDLEKVSP